MLAGQVNFRGSFPCSASNVLEPMLQCNLLLPIKRGGGGGGGGVGQVVMPAGQVNFRGSFPRSASNVLEPMLHHECVR